MKRKKIEFYLSISRTFCPFGMLVNSPHYSAARNGLKHAIKKLKLPLGVPTITGINSPIPKHTQEKIAKTLIDSSQPLKSSKEFKFAL
jgi:hypothetical protein